MKIVKMTVAALALSLSLVPGMVFAGDITLLQAGTGSVAVIAAGLDATGYLINVDQTGDAGSLAVVSQNDATSTITMGAITTDGAAVTADVLVELAQ